MALVTWALITLLLITGWLYSRYRYSHWSSLGVLGPPPIAFLGHFHKIFSPSHSRWVEEEVYSKHCRSGLCGLYDFFNPILMVGDLEVIKNVMIKDFDHFADRRVILSPHEDDRIMNEMLISENGERWKRLRSLMSPTFTSGKMRGMFPLVCGKADTLVSLCLREAKEKPFVDMKDNFGRYVMDTIATCAFGFESNSLVDQDDPFSKKAGIFSNIGLGTALKVVLLMIAPVFFKALNIQLWSKDLNFFNGIAKEAITARKNGKKRGDFLDLLLEAQAEEVSTSSESSKPILNDSNIVAQSVLFITAGYDTAASVMAFASYLLAKHVDAQKCLRRELQELVEEHGKVTYKGIMEAKFLNACLFETLRLYPPFPFTESLCTKTYKLPGTKVTLDPGHIVQIPIWSIHMDEQYWPEPKEFRPDRFMPENRENITNYTHMPFGLGPRNCLAMRFALMESKVALAKLILAADMSLAPGHEEISYTTLMGILKPDKGVPLVLKPLEEDKFLRCG